MSRMSGPARKRWYEFLVRRDGERCFIGGEPGSFDSMIVDHWNGRDSDNRPSNLHLLCRQMNSHKNPRGQGVLRKNVTEIELLSSLRVRRIDNDDVVRSVMAKAQSAEFSKNLHCEPNFRHWLFVCFVHVVELELSKVVRNGAELVGCSKESIKRYLTRLTAEAGMYRVKMNESTGKEIISLKPRWESFRKRNIENARLRVQVNNWKGDEIIQPIQTNIIRSNFSK